MATKETPSDRKTVAYLRVSTLDQDLEKNKADILLFANHHDLGKVNFVEEVASGRKPWRERQIAQVLEELQDGDAILWLNFRDWAAACWNAWRFWRLLRAKVFGSIR